MLVQAAFTFAELCCSVTFLVGSTWVQEWREA